MKIFKKILLIKGFALCSFFAVAQNNDTTNKAKVIMPPKIKPYADVITDKRVTDQGLFNVHKVDDRWYFEIPDSLLEKEMLIVNRIAKAPAGFKGDFGYSGDQIGENVITFSKGPNNKLFIKSISFTYRSNDSTENGMYKSVVNSNIPSIVAAFDIKAFTPDSSATVIDVTDYVSGDNDLLFFSPELRSKLGLGALQPDKSYIERIASFPLNIEIKTIKTFGSATVASAKTIELNSSMVMLPAKPMKPRYYDERVGYFATGYYDFDANSQGVESKSMITRWRLEPKDDEIEKYKRGELVEPKKPIVFYIDPATPKKWVPYLIQGVDDWQKSFEKAGFKNAIFALEAPVNDPEWSLEDARHNAIIYKPSTVANASGPHVHDPRTGEILEAHISWYHNVMSLVHDWYMIQAAAIDPRARKMEFDDSLMGQLIRFVSSHEVGHTLGLRHNFGASSTVPVDSLRNKKWVEAHGHTPSIMDYARFNYVAQPEDSISEKGIFPRIGTYDEWAIQWGYRIFSFMNSEQEEKKLLNKWVIDNQAKNGALWFGQEGASGFDPRCRAEDLGDNAMKAGYYGIQNLKRIVPHLIDWTREPAESYDNLKKMYTVLIDQYTGYLLSACSNIGGFMITPRTVEQKGNVVQFVPKTKQKEAIQFLNDQLFLGPSWLMDKKIFALTGIAGGGDEVYQMVALQQKIFRDILSPTKLGMLLRFEVYSPVEAYTVDNILDDLELNVFRELEQQKPISRYRRSLQKVFVEQLIGLLLNPEIVSDGFTHMSYAKYNQFTDIPDIIRMHLKSLLRSINSSLSFYKDKESGAHLDEIRERLNEALKTKHYK